MNLKFSQICGCQLNSVQISDHGVHLVVGYTGLLDSKTREKIKEKKGQKVIVAPVCELTFIIIQSFVGSGSDYCVAMRTDHNNFIM